MTTPTDTTIPYPRHNPLACLRCETIAPDAWRRHWKSEPAQRAWHAIADGPDLVARLPRSAHFVTILAYIPGPDTLPTCYKGPLYAEADGDFADVLRDMQRCVEFLTVEYDISPEAIRLWLSGGRSVHATIPAHVIGADDGHPLLPDIYAAMIETLFPKAMAPTLDRSIYNHGKGRMWRLPNRRRSDTRRYKVPISLAELLHKSAAELEALTHRPRKGVFWPGEDDLPSCPELVKLYHQVRGQVEADQARAIARRSEGTYQDGDGVLFHAFQARGWIEQELSPGKWSVVCPWADEHTKGTPGDSSTVLFAPRPGKTLGWWHCSHMHCAERTLEDVLALFSEQELQDARRAADLPTFSETSG
jgi:hypothetical protein